MRPSVLVLVLVLGLSACASKKPAVERDPARYTPAETDARKATRLQERIHAVQDRVSGWLRELEAGRGHATDEKALDGATERLRNAQGQLERVRQRANDVDVRAGEADDLERETLRIQDVAEKAYQDGLLALGRS
jgi:hypothetical protein